MFFKNKEYNDVSSMLRATVATALMLISAFIMSAILLLMIGCSSKEYGGNYTYYIEECESCRNG